MIQVEGAKGESIVQAKQRRVYDSRVQENPEGLIFARVARNDSVLIHQGSANVRSYHEFEAGVPPAIRFGPARRTELCLPAGPQGTVTH